MILVVPVTNRRQLTAYPREGKPRSLLSSTLNVRVVFVSRVYLRVYGERSASPILILTLA